MKKGKEILFSLFDVDLVDSLRELCDYVFYSDHYDVVILPRKRGCILVDALLSIGFLSLDKIKPAIYSDLFLECAEASRVLGGSRKICVFDDTLRYGRNIKRLLKKLSELNIPNDNIGVHVLCSNQECTCEFPVVFTSQHEMPIKELNYFSYQELLFYYVTQNPYVTDMPKSGLIRVGENGFKELLENGFKRVQGTSILETAGCEYYVMHMTEEQLKDAFGLEIHWKYAEAIVDMFAYRGASDEIEVQFVPRVSFDFVSLPSIMPLIDTFLKGLGASPEKIAEIAKETGIVQYSILRYFMSMWLFSRCFSRSVCFDNNAFSKHFGSYKELLSVVGHERLSAYKLEGGSHININKIPQGYDKNSCVKGDKTKFSSIENAFLYFQNKDELQSGSKEMIKYHVSYLKELYAKSGGNHSAESFDAHYAALLVCGGVIECLDDRKTGFLIDSARAGETAFYMARPYTEVLYLLNNLFLLLNADSKTRGMCYCNIGRAVEALKDAKDKIPNAKDYERYVKQGCMSKPDDNYVTTKDNERTSILSLPLDKDVVDLQRVYRALPQVKEYLEALI